MACGYSFNGHKLLTLLLVLGSCIGVFGEYNEYNCSENATITREPGYCVWFGNCLDYPKYVEGGALPCLYNGPAHNISSLGEDFMKMLTDTCPQYIEGGKVCCGQGQLLALATQIKYPKQLFARCPACLKNMINHFCATTCDPDQSLFMNPTKCISSSKDEWKPAVSNIDIYLSMNYSEELYGSCDNVQYPQASNRVVDIMCGGTDTCNSTLWLSFLADPNQNHNSPFPFVYKIGLNESELPEDVEPRDVELVPCNFPDPKLRCSCADCETPDLCPPPPQPPQHTFPVKTIFDSIIGVGIFLSVALFVAAMVIGMYLMYQRHATGYASEGYGTLRDDSPTSSVGSLNGDDIKLKKKEMMIEPPFASKICKPFYLSGAHLENWIKTVFYHWGCFVARFWFLVIAVGVGLVVFIVVLTAVLHLTNTLPFVITTNPVELWSAPNSRARQEKNYFDEHFNPFYRTEMLIFTTSTENSFTFQPQGVYGVNNWTFGPVLTNNVLLEVFEIQEHLLNMVAEGTSDDGEPINVTLSDICYKPLAPENEECTVMSVLNYFQNNKTRLLHSEDFGLVNNSYHIHYCTRDPTAVEGVYFPEMQIPCLGGFGGPVDPNVALGGFNTMENGSPNYQNATALIVTFPVNNHVDETDNKPAEIWESAFISYIKSVSKTLNHTHVTYMAERSIEDELTRESKTDVVTILVSYLLMFAYITLFLGHLRKPITLLIDMKITIGFLGVLMVLFAVVGSICFLNLTRVTVTLIIIEVVPFLVLAVGVDNLFIIVHSYERQVRKFAEANQGDLRDVPVKELIGRAIAEVAPSLLLTSLSETTAFLLGAISSMPAVRTFSLYAGVAVFFNFLLQVSVFLAALSVDARRQLANRFDLICYKLKGMFDPRKGLSVMPTIMDWFARFILNPLVRPSILLIFGITTTCSIAFAFKIDIGLDQTLALPKDSYVNSYFRDMYKYLHTGSPVYFVIKDGFNYSDPNYQRLFCSAAGCDMHSIGTEIFGYSRNKELTGIAEPAMLWLDTYFEWIDPHSECCGKDVKTGERCLYPSKDSNATCRACVTELNKTTNWPYPDDFEEFLPWFLEDNPGKRCPSGGHAAFAGAVKLDPDNSSVITSYVMTLHTIMSNSTSFINGLKWARKLGETLTDYIGVEIFPYSVFYVYYEQYLTTVHDMALNIGVSIGAVFIVTFLMMGLNLGAALIVMLIVCMIIVHMLGCMSLAGINANAVSLVNLVMTVGIAVEFCSHIVRWFCSCSEPSREERARSALANMGASVVSGITLTKLIGVFVLFFAKSQIFEIYYFRMYMFMLLWGALHGLVLLPVLLSYIGPPYSPIEVKPPYDDVVVPKVTSPSPQSSTKGKTRPSAPSPVPSAPNPSSTVQYPSLPNVGAYDPKRPAEGQALSSRQQQYPKATYPKQRYYQERGEVYQEPTERSKLLA